jgi:hypothetical protein
MWDRRTAYIINEMMIKTINKAMAKIKIGTLDGDKLWMETFPTHTALVEEVLLRAKLEYLYGYPKFHKLYHGSVNRLLLDQITVWFNGKEGFDTANNYGDNQEWVLITREV